MLEGKSIVIFGAHPDDIELGMGGTLNQIKHLNPKVVVFSDTVQYNGDAIREEFYNSMKSMGIEATLHTYEVDNLDMVEIRRLMLVYREADVFFSPSRNSTHQDHRDIGQAVNDIMLEKTVFYFEEIRSGQNQNINCWNPISSDDLIEKYRLLDFYKTQDKRHYLTPESVAAMAQFRGGQIKSNYAEAFEVNRLVM